MSSTEWWICLRSSSRQNPISVIFLRLLRVHHFVKWGNWKSCSTSVCRWIVSIVAKQRSSVDFLIDMKLNFGHQIMALDFFLSAKSKLQTTKRKLKKLSFDDSKSTQIKRGKNCCYFSVEFSSVIQKYLLLFLHAFRVIFQYSNYRFSLAFSTQQTYSIQRKQFAFFVVFFRSVAIVRWSFCSGTDHKNFHFKWLLC